MKLPIYSFSVLAVLAFTACKNNASEEQEAVTEEVVEVVDETPTPLAEMFQEVDPADFNARIANEKIGTVEEVVEMYYPIEPAEGEGPQVSMHSETMEDGSHVVTLINEGVMDDSIAAEKIVMTATEMDLHWTVTSIKKNWKCREGRGHTDWGTEYCQ